MNPSTRQFTDKPAVREAVPLLIGLFGPSGGGKSFSALRLATGIQRVSGGKIYAIDTEARRMLHYADKFKFQHVDFKAPFGPLDYLAAVEHCVNQGAKVIIVDSMSHEHDGTGGVLDQHETIMGDNQAKNMLAWKKPKAERRRLINSVLQMNVNFIFCFRAKEKIKIVGNKPVQQGFMPIAGEEFLFEQTVNCLLMPKANGVPEWNPQESGERMMTKLPDQFYDLFKVPRSLDEDIGQHLAEWAKGSTCGLANRSTSIGTGQSHTATPPPISAQTSNGTPTLDLNIPLLPPISEPGSDDGIEIYIGQVEQLKRNGAAGFSLVMKDGQIFSTPNDSVIDFCKRNKGKDVKIAHFGNQIETITLAEK